MDIEIVQLSKYIQPDIIPYLSRKYVLNGDNNSFYKYINDCYEGSVTNAGIINAFSNYIYGEGLIDLNGSNISKYISKKDARLICLDYKLYGGFAVQIIWNLAKTKPVQVKYIPVYKLGLSLDKDMEINGYWYSFDWELNARYRPKFYPKFDGVYKEENLEMLIVQRPSSKPFFSNPDYVSALQYAQVEMELANSTINHILNGFQGGTIINCNGGVPETEELKELYRRKIIDGLTGTNNNNKLVVSFNDNEEQSIKVETIPLPELNQSYESFNSTAETKIIIGHSAPPILFTGSRDGGGLGNNAEELKTATESLYKKTINPMREVIIDGLNEIFRFIDSNIDLDFKDFDETIAETKSETTDVKFAGEVPPFHDNCKCELVDGVITNIDACDYCKEMISNNPDIISLLGEK